MRIADTYKNYSVEDLKDVISVAELNQSAELDLSSRGILQLPPEIGQCKSLKILRLGGKGSFEFTRNELKQLPREFALLKQLTHLDLNSNQFSEIPDEIFYLKNLSHLDLSFNYLSAVSREIAFLGNLTYLDLSNNNLNHLPKEICLLSNLKHLYLVNNKIKKLPKEIGKLKNLTHLFLGFNQIDELPQELNQLNNLECLDLRSNNLKSIESDIINIETLENIDLTGNPMVLPPVEIASQGLSALRDYFRTADKKGETLYEGKLLVVGQGGVGKTCLIRRLLKDRYVADQNSTRGIDINRWQVMLPETPPKKLTLNVWDFGGQEIYHSTHQFFLTKRSLYILVWDACMEEEHARIDYWLNVIGTFADDSPIIILMNKADQRVKDLNIRDLKIRCPQIIASGKVSAKTNVGIDNLKKFITNQAWKMPLMGTFWPYSWLIIRRKIEEESRNQISLSEYLDLCNSCGINEKEADTLSRYLHDLGVILHFQDDLLLKDTIILKPEWATEAVYKVLDAELVIKRKGMLHLDELPMIWNDKNLYPPEKYATILRLMSKFELAFPIASGNQYIVPELLSSKEPKISWKSQNALRFEYHYDFLPAGIMTRLIVRMHDFLIDYKDKKLCWREGAYFGFDNSQAMVRVNPYTKIAILEIVGAKKREFMAIIRHHFFAIHKPIKNIRFTEKIPCNCSPGCSHRFDYNFLLKCENKGKITQTCEKTLDDVNVSELLEGIEQISERKKKTYAKDISSEGKAIPFNYKQKKIFISYSHKDRKWLDKLLPHLGVLKFNNVTISFDQEIKAGENWNPELLESIRSSQVVLCLVSKEFLNSDFIRNEEVPEMLKMREKGLKLIPLLLDTCAWKRVEWLSKIQMHEEMPLSQLDENEQEQKLVSLVDEISRVYETA